MQLELSEPTWSVPSTVRKSHIRGVHLRHHRRMCRLQCPSRFGWIEMAGWRGLLRRVRLFPLVPIAVFVGWWWLLWRWLLYRHCWCSGGARNFCTVVVFSCCRKSRERMKRGAVWLMPWGVGSSWWWWWWYCYILWAASFGWTRWHQSSLVTTRALSSWHGHGKWCQKRKTCRWSAVAVKIVLIPLYVRMKSRFQG